MGVDSTSLTNDLLSRIGKVLGVLLGVGADRTVGIAQVLLSCSGDACVEEVSSIVDGAITDLVWRKQTALIASSVFPLSVRMLVSALAIAVAVSAVGSPRLSRNN